MNHAISVELQFFLISVLWGQILLLVYDCLRILRRLIKHDSFFVALEDLFFWVCASLFIFAMMYEENNGIIRGFSFMGMAIGMVLYHYILSEFLVNIVTKFIRTLISPFTFMIKKIRQFIKLIISKGKKALNFIIRRLKKWVKSVRIALNIRKQASIVKKQASVAKKQASVAKRQASVAKKKASVAKKQASVAKKQASVAKKQVSVAKKQVSVAKKQESVAKIVESVDKKQASEDIKQASVATKQKKMLEKRTVGKKKTVGKNTKVDKK